MATWQFLLAIIPTLVGGCFFFDRISTDEIRGALAAAIRGNPSLRSMSVAEFLRYFIENTIGAFYRGSHLSWANTRKSIGLSFIALIVIIAAVSVAQKKYPHELLTIWGPFSSTDNMTLVTILILGTLTTDVISFLQTAMFFRIATQIRSLPDILFIAACDLIITINLFVFVFPVFLIGALHFIDCRGRTIQLEFEVQDETEITRRGPDGNQLTELVNARKRLDLKAHIYFGIGL
jgi:hypothetical protein